MLFRMAEIVVSALERERIESIAIELNAAIDEFFSDLRPELKQDEWDLLTRYARSCIRRALEIAEADHSLLRFYVPPEARWPAINGREPFVWPEDERPRDIGERCQLRRSGTGWQRGDILALACRARGRYSAAVSNPAARDGAAQVQAR